MFSLLDPGQRKSRPFYVFDPARGLGFGGIAIFLPIAEVRLIGVYGLDGLPLHTAADQSRSPLLGA